MSRASQSPTDKTYKYNRSQIKLALFWWVFKTEPVTFQKEYIKSVKPGFCITTKWLDSYFSSLFNNNNEVFLQGKYSSQIKYRRNHTENHSMLSSNESVFLSKPQLINSPYLIFAEGWHKENIIALSSTSLLSFHL